MDTSTQQLIIKILGFLATLTLIETIILSLINVPETITTQVILLAGNIIGGLIGFIAGKTLTEKQQETLNTKTPITPMTDEEIIQLIEDLENKEEYQNTNTPPPEEVTMNVQHRQENTQTKQ